MTQATALLLTLAVEVPVVAAATWLAGRSRAEVARLALTAVGASVLTHPLLWLADSALAGALGWTERTALLEAAVALVEGAAYAVFGGTGWRRGLGLSLLANALSLGLGLVLYA